MVVGLAGALLAAVLFGVASALQARGAQAVPASGGLGAQGLLRIARQWPFLLGLLCDLCGFVAELAALRHLPLFAVQAAIAASLAVTAVVAVPLLGVRLAGREWIAVLAVCAGLAALGLSAGAEGPPRVGDDFRWGLVAGTGALILAGAAVGRLTGRPRCVGLGFAGGLGFGVVAVAARILTGFAPGELVWDPAAYLVVAAGIAAFAFYTSALQVGSVTTATAAMVVGETVMPAAVGVFLLHEHTRPGFVPVAVCGFLLAVTGALVLGRFGEPDST